MEYCCVSLRVVRAVWSLGERRFSNCWRKDCNCWSRLSCSGIPSRRATLFVISCKWLAASYPSPKRLTSTSIFSLVTASSQEEQIWSHSTKASNCVLQTFILFWIPFRSESTSVSELRSISLVVVAKSRMSVLSISMLSESSTTSVNYMIRKKRISRPFQEVFPTTFPFDSRYSLRNPEIAPGLSLSGPREMSRDPPYSPLRPRKSWSTPKHWIECLKSPKGL